MSRKLKLTNCNQFEVLVAELEKNPTLAKGIGKGAISVDFKEKWDKIALKLNALGPPNRDTYGWQKVWRDCKFKTKKKIVQIKTGTCGRSFKEVKLSALEEAVANLMHFKKDHEDETSSVDSETETVPFSEDEMVTLENEIGPDLQFTADESTVSTNKHAKPSSRARNNSKQTTSAGKNFRNSLLQKHSDMQEKVLYEMSQTMISVQNSLEDLRRLKEKELDLLERKHKREEELFQNDLEIKKIKLEKERAELKILTNDKNCDPEAMFFKSLLPDVQKLNGPDRGKIKIEFQKILQDYLYPA